MTAKIYLKKGREASILRFHPWVFSGAVTNVVGNPAEGDLVGVYSSTGEILAMGHWQVGSIVVRILSFAGDPSSAVFWTDALRAAYELRAGVGLVNSRKTNCYRLVHGEGDGLPGLIIDYYDGVIVMQAHSAGMFRAKKQICEALQSLYGQKLKAV